MAIIKSKKDLFNDGQCFTKGNEYEVKQELHNTASLIDAIVESNDLGERHIIGMWWRNFKIIKN